MHVDPHNAPPIHTALRDYLATHDDPCPSCGYCLRGLTTDVCPECRERLVLCVRPAETKLAWFIAGLVAWGGMVGFNGLIGAYFMWEWLSQRRWGPSFSDALPLGVSLAVGLVMGSLWIGRRKRIGRWPAPARWWLAVLAWVCMVASALWFFGWVR